LLRFKDWFVQPFLGLGYTSLDEEAFEETGAGDVSLIMEDRRTESLLSDLGVRFGPELRLGNVRVLPELKAAWLHNYDIDDRAVTASMAGSPQTSFAIPARDVETDGALLGAAVTLFNGEGLSLTVQYDGEYWEDRADHGVIGQLRYEF
jgi:outer membrane autotransporter protein